jgi:hypothetical protein
LTERAERNPEFGISNIEEIDANGGDLVILQKGDPA